MQVNVSGVADRSKAFPSARSGSELFAQRADQIIDTPVARVRRAPQRSAREVFPRDYLTGRSKKKMQNIEFGSRTFDRSAVAFHGLRSCVKNQVVDCEEGTAKSGGLAAAKDGSDSCEELNRREWFGNVIIGPGLQTADLVHDGRSRGQHDDRDAALLPDLAKYAEPIHVREHDIEDHENQAPLVQSVEACLRGAGEVNSKSLGPEIFGEHFCHVAVVIDQQKLTQSRLRTGSGWRFRTGSHIHHNALFHDGVPGSCSSTVWAIIPAGV